jgi:glycosyltransferase involved in cell wall biosynthesis
MVGGMKVLVLGVRGLPNVQGGVETHVEQLYSRLAEMGCEVEVIVRTPFVPTITRAHGDIRLRRIWAPRASGFEALVHSILGVLYAGVVRPDILHIHAVGPCAVTPIARLLGLRVVVTHHGPDYERDKWGRFARWVLRTGENLGMRYSHARIAISRGIQTLIQSGYGRQADLILNGVVAGDPETDMSEIRRRGLTRGRYFLQVSRVVPEKRQLDLIEAYASLPNRDWKLVLVGGPGKDPYARKVEAAAKKAGVIMTGYLAGSPLRQLYSHAGAFVLPSSHEGLPIAILEALSYGLPVIASAIPANLEIGLDSRRYFPLGDVPALSQRLTDIIRSPDDEAIRAERRRWVTDTYDWTRIARQTLDVYRRVLSGPSVAVLAR